MMTRPQGSKRQRYVYTEEQIKAMTAKRHEKKVAREEKAVADNVLVNPDLPESDGNSCEQITAAVIAGAHKIPKVFNKGLMAVATSSKFDVLLTKPSKSLGVLDSYTPCSFPVLVDAIVTNMEMMKEFAKTEQSGPFLLIDTDLKDA